MVIPARQRSNVRKGRTMKTMRLEDFTRRLDTVEPINVYLDGCWDGAYELEKIPDWYKKLELSDIYYDAEGISVSIYTA